MSRIRPHSISPAFPYGSFFMARYPSSLSGKAVEYSSITSPSTSAVTLPSQYSGRSTLKVWASMWRAAALHCSSAWRAASSSAAFLAATAVSRRFVAACCSASTLGASLPLYAMASVTASLITSSSVTSTASMGVKSKTESCSASSAKSIFSPLAKASSIVSSAFVQGTWSV